MRKFRGLVIVVTLCCGIWVLIGRCNSSTSTNVAAGAPITLTAAETAVVWGLVAGTILLFSLLIRWVWRSITKKNGDTDPPPRNYAGWKKFGKSLGTVAICVLIGWVIYLGYGWWEKPRTSQSPGREVAVAQKPRQPGYDELIATSDGWSRPIIVPPQSECQIYEDGYGWIKFPSGEVREIGPDVNVRWPEVAPGELRFKARNSPITVRVFWERR